MNIKVTNKALDEIKKVIKDKNATSKKIRIFLAGIGWGGPKFNLALDEQKENDEIYREGSVDFVTDKSLIEQYSGFKIDYSNFFLQRGFLIHPYNGPTSTCWEIVNK